MTKKEAVNLLRANVMVACDTSDKVGYGTPLNKAIEEALNMAIKALEIVEEFEKAQIITGGRLNGRTYAYKCGQQNMKVLMIKKIKEARTKIKNSIEPIVGTYNRETPERDWPSYKILRNKGREDALEILDKLIEGMN